MFDLMLVFSKDDVHTTTVHTIDAVLKTNTTDINLIVETPILTTTTSNDWYMLLLITRFYNLSLKGLLILKNLMMPTRNPIPKMERLRVSYDGCFDHYFFLPNLRILYSNM